MRVRVGVEMLAVLAVVLLAPSGTEALVLNKCELRQQLNLTLLVDHINEVAKIVCHAELSSHLNTSAVNQIHAPHWDPSENKSQEHNSVGQHKDDHSHPGPSVQPNVSKPPPAPGAHPAHGGHPGTPGQKKRHRRSAPGIPKHSPPPHNKPAGVDHQTGHNSSDHSHPAASPSSPLAPHNDSQEHASGPGDHKSKSPKPSSAPINNSAPGIPKHPSKEHPTVGNQTGQHKDGHSHPGPSVQPNVSKSPPAPGGHPGASGQKNRHRRSALGIPKHSTPPNNKPQIHGNQNNNNHSHPGASPSSPLAPHNVSHEHSSGPGNHTTRSPKPLSAQSKNPPSHNHQPASPKPQQPKPSPVSIKSFSSKSPPGGNHPKSNGRQSRSLKGHHNSQGVPKPDSHPHNESSEHQHPVASFNISLVNHTNHHEKQGHDQGHGSRRSRSVKPVGETSHEQHGDDTWTLYGLFQLADRVACLSDKPSLNLCGLSCDKLIDDDITDDIACVETIIGTKMSTLNDHRKELIKSMYDLLHQKECANVEDLPYFSSC